MLPSLRGRLPGWLALASLALALAMPLRAQPVAGMTEPQASADNSTFDFNTKQTLLQGNAKIIYGDLILTADEIRYSSETRVAFAKGNFVLTRGDRRLVADEGSYNLSDDTLHVRHLRLGRFPFYLTGETVDGTLENLVLTNATIFFRENAPYAPSVHATKLNYQRDRIVSADGVRLGLLGGHFIAMPHFEHDLESALITYMSGRAGYRNNLGAFFEFGAHLPVALGVKLGADGGLYTSRGLMIGPSGTYNTGNGQGDTTRGFFRSGYIHDYGERLTDVIGEPIPIDRSFFEWRHQQRIGEHFTLDGQFNYWSDSEVLRDFKRGWFYPVQEPDSYLEANYTGQNYFLTAFTRVNPNHYYRQVERLPELRFDLLPTPIGGGIVERFNSSATVLEKDSLLGSPREHTTRLDAYYGIERPIALAPWFSFTPVAGGRVTHYTDAAGGKDTYTRTIGEFGFDAVMHANGTFDYKNELWDIDGLRHVVEPKISYRYAPLAARGQAYIPPIDERVFTTYLLPLSIADQRNVDDLDRLDTMRFSLNNTLQTRDKTHGTRDLASINFAADYRFARTVSQRPLSDLYTELAVNPTPWLSLESYHRVTLQDHAQQELNYGIAITDQDWWSARLISHFLRNDYEEYMLEYRQRVNEAFDAFARWRYDVRNSRFNEQTYGVSQRIGQTWSVRYEVSFTQGQRRESSFGLNIEVELLKF